MDYPASSTETRRTLLLTPSHAGSTTRSGLHVASGEKAPKLGPGIVLRLSVKNIRPRLASSPVVRDGARGPSGQGPARSPPDGDLLSRRSHAHRHRPRRPAPPHFTADLGTRPPAGPESCPVSLVPWPAVPRRHGAASGMPAMPIEYRPSLEPPCKKFTRSTVWFPDESARLGKKKDQRVSQPPVACSGLWPWSLPNRSRQKISWFCPPDASEARSYLAAFYDPTGAARWLSPKKSTAGDPWCLVACNQGLVDLPTPRIHLPSSSLVDGSE